MFIYFLAALFAVTTGYCYYQWRNCFNGQLRMITTLNQQERAIGLLKEAIETQFGHYRDLETGMSEQEENYEMQFLTFEENLAKKDEEITVLEAYLEKHDRECIPDLKDLRWKALDTFREGA